jgi:hypothetical protein
VGAGFFWLLITIFTTCVRSFNQEPFVRLAWAHAIGSVATVIPAAIWWGTTGVLLVSLLGNAVISLLCLRHVVRVLKT